MNLTDNNLATEKAYKMYLCTEFFNKLTDALKDSYEIVASCNKDITKYLIPKGTISDLSYISKPDASFRFSDHWNWYSNLEKCPKESYIQCLCSDLPRAKNRVAPGKASKPIYAISVCFIGKDGKYHHVFGEKFNRKTKEWSWVEKEVDDVLKEIA